MFLSGLNTGKMSSWVDEYPGSPMLGERVIECFYYLASFGDMVFRGGRTIQGYIRDA